MVDALGHAGFAADINREVFPEEDPKTNEYHTAIWVGYAVPAMVAIESIKIAASHWPHLKYMHLSNDGITPPEYVHRQMYFGGATSTAKKYELLSWSHEELIALDEKMSQKQFHQLIRKKYA